MTGASGPGGSVPIVATRSGAGEFHARPIPDPARPEIWRHEVTAPAVVLGSTQDDHVVDRAACARLGVEVVRRRSGGGAVLVAPGSVTWIDVIVPRGGPGWADDVHAPMRWLGDALADAIGSVGAVRHGAAVEVHRGAMERSPNSSLICFDGLAPGELTLDGGKLVGISQRRIRAAARLQACWYHRDEQATLLSVIDADLRPDPASLRPLATIDAGHSDAIVTALAARLNRGDQPR